MVMKTMIMVIHAIDKVKKGPYRVLKIEAGKIVSDTFA